MPGDVMKISVFKADPTAEKADVLVVPAYQGEKTLRALAAALDASLDGELRRALDEDKFSAKLGEIYVFRTPKAFRAKRIAVIGMGPKKEASEETLRIVTASFLDRVKTFDVKTVACPMLGIEAGIPTKAAAKAMIEGARLSMYHFGRYKKNEHKPPTELALFVSTATEEKQALAGVAHGEILSHAANSARELVNTPGGHMRPIDLVETAREIAKRKGIRMKVYDKAAMEKFGMGGVLGVAQGSDHEPYLVHLVYKPAKAKKRVALVGKAVTFDSGGLSLKPANSMMTMKCDMAGAAAVLGAFSALPELAPSVEVHGFFAAVENMPSGKAIRPGDVLRLMNGKTIEVLNTDAEGRLTLADVLVFANKQKPDYLIDLATLTGACVVALGEEYTGLMTNNAALGKKVLASAEEAGEKMWELPLPTSYKKQIVSDIADYNNTGGRWGGSITAGLLLAEFAGETPWVHLDIAGPAFAEQAYNAYTKKGGTGHGARTLIEFIRSI
jgi:leucyl aminopeptidase